nr:MAG TPA: hypothetical protein [Caudoviricetes sp.]DAP64159.1 MAG TPA: hypothetical protein [Caudoviricetes sp.]DAQ96484.1 MAG TPA: hypothetical protein [Caudoviricetes sp.]
MLLLLPTSKTCQPCWFDRVTDFCYRKKNFVALLRRG